MKEIIQYIEIIGQTYSDYEKALITDCVERLYINVIKSWVPFKWIRFTEEYKISKDLLRLQGIISRRERLEIKVFKSRKFRNYRYFEDKENKILTEAEVRTISDTLIKECLPIKTAVFLLSNFDIESRKAKLYFVVTSIVSIIAIEHVANTLGIG